MEKSRQRFLTGRRCRRLRASLRNRLLKFAPEQALEPGRPLFGSIRLPPVLPKGLAGDLAVGGYGFCPLSAMKRERCARLAAAFQ